MKESVDYQAVVADLKARRARLDQLIAGFEALILGQGDAGSVEVVEPGEAATGVLPAAIHADTFFGLSLGDAAKKFLKMARRAQHTAAIADAIGKGGLKRPDVNVLSSILVRAAKGREITKVGKGMWGLSEWYPKRSAEPEEERSKPQTRKTKNSKRAPRAHKAARPASSTAAKMSPSNGSSPHGTLSPLLLEILTAQGKPAHVREITNQVNAKGNTASRATIEGTLNRWYKQGKVKKPKPGTFAL